jgi:dGTPase
MHALKDVRRTQVIRVGPWWKWKRPVLKCWAGLLEAFITTVNDIAANGSRASPKSRMLIHLIPEPFAGPGRQPVADLYRRVLAITDFVSGMTDSYAVSCSRN